MAKVAKLADTKTPVNEGTFHFLPSIKSDNVSLEIQESDELGSDTKQNKNIQENEGFGRFEYQNGTIYEGQWKLYNGKKEKHGEGHLIHTGNLCPMKFTRGIFIHWQQETNNQI